MYLHKTKLALKPTMHHVPQSRFCVCVYVQFMNINISVEEKEKQLGGLDNLHKAKHTSVSQRSRKPRARPRMQEKRGGVTTVTGQWAEGGRQDGYQKSKN